VSQDDPVKLRELLSKGIKGTTKSIDGATPLHRAAELGTIRCAEVLLKYCKNINIDAENC
jgi:ankyrin repeat protein